MCTLEISSLADSNRTCSPRVAITDANTMIPYQIPMSIYEFYFHESSDLIIKELGRTESIPQVASGVFRLDSETGLVYSWRLR